VIVLPRAPPDKGTAEGPAPGIFDEFRKAGQNQHVEKAMQELPETADHQRDAQLLQKFGIHPGQLAERGPASLELGADRPAGYEGARAELIAWRVRSSAATSRRSLPWKRCAGTGTVTAATAPSGVATTAPTAQIPSVCSSRS